MSNRYRDDYTLEEDRVDLTDYMDLSRRQEDQARAQRLLNQADALVGYQDALNRLKEATASGNQMTQLQAFKDVQDASKKVGPVGQTEAWTPPVDEPIGASPPAPPLLSDISPAPGEDQVPAGTPDFTNYGTPSEPVDFDAPFKQVGQYFEERQGEMADTAKNAYHAGDVGAGMILQAGSVSTKFLWGAFEGATFILRPWNWIPSLQGMWGLATDEKVRSQAVETFMADPLGGVAFGAGSFVGGYGSGKVIGKVTDIVAGRPGKATTLQNIQASVDDMGDATIKATKTSTKNLPRGVVDVMDDSKPNRLLVVAEEEAVTRGPLKGMGQRGPDVRTPTGVQKAIILEMDEAKITQLTKTRSSIVDRLLRREPGEVKVGKLTGSVQATPEDVLRMGGDVADTPGQLGRLKGLTQFKETQTGTTARGPPSYVRAGSTGLGMEDAWLGVRSASQETPGALSPWDFTRPSGTFEGTTFSNFRAKVIGGAKVIKETADTVNDWTPDVIKPTGGPKTPLSRLSNVLQGQASKITQEAVVGDLKRIFKRGATPLPEESMVPASGATGASSVLKTTGQTVTRMTGDVSIFSPVATSYGPQVGAFSNVGLFNRARDRLDQTPQVGLKDLTGDLSKSDTYLDSSQREKIQDPEPVRIFEPDPVKQPDPFKPYEPEPVKEPEPEPIKPWTPDPTKPRPPIIDTVQDTRIIWDPGPAPPPPPPPPPTWTRKVPAVSPLWGPGGGLWGGPQTRVKSKTKKKVYQVADPLRLIGSELNKPKKYKNPRKRSPLEMIF